MARAATEIRNVVKRPTNPLVPCFRDLGRAADGELQNYCRAIDSGQRRFWYRLTSSQEDCEDGKYQNPAKKICCKKSGSHLTPGAGDGRSTEKTKLKVESNTGTISHGPLSPEMRFPVQRCSDDSKFLEFFFVHRVSRGVVPMIWKNNFYVRRNIFTLPIIVRSTISSLSRRSGTIVE